MPKLGTLVVLCLCITSSFAQSLIQLESGIKLSTLSQLSAVDVEHLKCSPQLLQISNSMQTWSEILKNQDQLDQDIEALVQIHLSISKLKQQNYRSYVFAQIRESHNQLLLQIMDNKFTQFTPYQAWRQEGFDKVQTQLNLLDQSTNPKENQEQCDKIEQLLDKLLKERQEVKRQCQTPAITINIINSKAEKVQETADQCHKSGIPISFQPEGQLAQPVSQAPETQPDEPSDDDGVESSEDEEDKDPNLNTKSRTSDFTKGEPLVTKESESKDVPFKEYGYGLWIRFMIAYPVKLPNGKDAPWYFVSRLTSNKVYSNLENGDRLLAVWLGKGYYHMTTCDSEKKNPNIIQNINYPEDIDGLWTYVYYSYSVEKKKAVAFIKFGDDDQPIKSITHLTTHPTTQYLKLIIGGNDQERYPAFNGVMTSIYFSARQGVFIDSDDELQGMLQAQKKQPQSVIPNLISYKLVNQPITRDPKTNEIHQIIGSAKPKFPHEYAFSGWFKWTPLANQEEWHNAFRVQISTPSTDKFLGDRTLSMWVAKQGGVLHFPTYSADTMEGAGNANLFRNIAHKDQHTKWFFVYFGYSKPQRNAYAYVKLADGEDSQDYLKVNHYTVAKFYVFIGKDKHFSGFSGQIAHAAFTVGEGAFRKSNDFKKKNDPFRFSLGAKQLTGAKPSDKEILSEDEDDGVVHVSSTEENKPKVDEQVDNIEQLSEYGYGFWARYLTLYPQRMANGISAPYYFVSRLTVNKNYGNIEMGDRTLAIWQAQGGYLYITCNTVNKNPNVVANMVYPNDIEGVWTFFYYSYSIAEKKAIGFAKYGNQEPRMIEQQVTHPTSKYLRFILGGKDANRYPGFNGLFSQVHFSHKEGAFIDTIEEVNDYIKRSLIPTHDLSQVYKHELVDNQISRKPTDVPDYDEIGGGQQKFPHEYAISGWFKWQPTTQSEWHNVFRVQIKKPSTDQFLGDRTLSLWVGRQQGGILHFPTYTYTTMNGQGNANLVKNIKHNNRHVDWFFVYFGYSKNDRKAYAAVRFSNSIEVIEYTGVNHYYTPKFYSYVGKDQQFSGFSGKVAYVNFALGQGAFRNVPNFKHPEDLFGLAQGEAAILKKPVVKPQPTVDKETGLQYLPNAVNDNKPKVEQETNTDQPLSEYGYGYWARFLTNYPVRLYNGKNAAWYFVSRLSMNKSGNIGMGDRMLAIWQGQGYYHFTTCNAANGQANVVKNINYPTDIEGVWTYFYYSYSVDKKKAIAFVKFGDQEPQSIQHDVTQPTTRYLRFTVGGKDSNTYPGFNGQFASVVYSAAPGTFIESLAQFNTHITKKISPFSVKHALTTIKLVEAQVSRVTNTAPAKENVDVQFPREYSLSGWFKWEPTNQQTWHNAFRVQIQTPSNDRFLGDRTLAMWVGTTGGGILHLSTYSYTNMNGAGSNNMPQNIQHRNRHIEWFYVYFGYSKNDKHGNAYVKWGKSEDSLEFKNINHYFTSTFYVFAGKDNHYPGFNGKVAYTSFNAGEGAYRRGTDFAHPSDIFRLEKGTSNLFPKGDPSKPAVDEKGELPNAFNNNAPRIDKVMTGADTIQEYGYGYWARFLTAYPERLIYGKNAPWYFMSRLTVNQQYDNVRMGDRALAIWQGQGYYHFTTCNSGNGQVNVIQNINYLTDIEGTWTYIYYSFSVQARKAVAYIKFARDDPKSIVHQITHPPTKSVRFILGGMDNNRYPAFNGIFTQITYSIERGTYIDNSAAFNSLSGRLPETTITQKKYSLVADVLDRSPNVAGQEQTIGDDTTKLPTQYAISGWFKWYPTNQQAWHNAFRVQIKSPSTDRFLGDRTLSMWVGNSGGGILHFPTYSYANMNGAGNANLVQNIVHKDRHTEWFFVYYGYSKTDRTAYAFVKWRQSEDSLNYAQCNHYYAPKFYVFTGKDTMYPGFSGKVAYVNFNLGEGSFKKSNDYTNGDDWFGFGVGTKELFKPKQPDALPEPEKLVHENKASDGNPKYDKSTRPATDNLVEYGYGYWLRFLTAYPERLINGKNQPWYFMSRLTVHQEYDNIRMGDRTLAMWQGQGNYIFVTCNTENNQANVVNGVNYPNDIEGVWTYVYYSYSAKEKQAVGFIKQGNNDFEQITQRVTNPVTKQVRFIVGGNDEKRYPGFNGLFTRIYFNPKEGAYINSINAVKKFLSDQGAEPSIGVPSIITKPLLEDEVNRVINDEPLFAEVADKRLAQEYSFSGWFKWKPVAQQPWHNLFRVSIKEPSSDAFLGDRTLTCWLGTPDGGILHFPTYSYTNMNGGGNTNYFKNVAHKNRHTEWFFVYFGYSKPQAQAQVLVKWKESDDTLDYVNANHYLVSQFFIYVGKDKHFPGFNGKVSTVRFNIGVGSFKKGTDVSHAEDAFGYKAGVDKYMKKVDQKIDSGDKPVDRTVHENSHDEKTPRVDKNIQQDRQLTTYGYGFWARFLTAYPKRLLSGKNAPWYFVARLTANREYDNVRMSDRTLAIWQGQGYYHFTTCNSVNGNVNVIQNIEYPEDIEGVWTYIYYSYSDDVDEAVGFIKYGNNDAKSITHKVTHPATKFVRFILGGTDENRYPGFNGLFTQVTFTSDNAFIRNDVQFTQHMKNIIVPRPDVDGLIKSKLIEAPITRNLDDEPSNYQVIGGGDNKFPREYGISGWFKWRNCAQQAWHNLFRVQIKTPSTDNFLGDRALSMWMGTSEGGILHFPTYSYTSMNGAGNTNLYKNILHKGRHTEWFFVYFGYSKPQNTAYAYVKWRDSDDTLLYEKVNHYVVSEFFVFSGRDKHFVGHSGSIAYLNFIIGQGAFLKGKDFVHPQDVFGFAAGSELVKKEDSLKPEPSDADKTLLTSSIDQKKSVIDKEATDSNYLVEYGYGFWARFLTVYPVRLLAGKNQAWYFVARLTANREYDNIRMSDRTLAIWQGQGYYHFTTCNSVNGNVNVIQNINYPDDIEGVWTYIYYSYSDQRQKAVAMIKYGSGDIQTITHQVTHPRTKYVRFILGGTDENRYPGFNGMFTQISFTAKTGAFIEKTEDLLTYLSKVGTPTTTVTQQYTKRLIEDQIQRDENTDPIYAVIGNDDQRFPHEYAISGWFKWQPTNQKPWHNIFRVQIKTPSTDAFLGDRTLSAWLGAGILHFPTYTYTNMNGAGNTNYHQNIDHKDRHQQWFFVYFGYSKKEFNAYIFVKWTGSEDSLNYEKINHYFAPEFFVFVGRDKHFPGFNGRIGHVNFNLGKGSFVKGNNYGHQNDAFGLAAGLEAFVNKQAVPFQPSDPERGVKENTYDSPKPAFDKDASTDKYLEEYGYGFWARFLTAYPQRLLAGKNQPWYFVSRLTANKEYDNVRMNDRTLAIWQGQGYYHFTTCNQATNNPNQIVNVNYPDDIEGVWTFIYYSYSADENKAVAFIKYGSQEIQTAVHKTTHQSTKFVRFILGGTDEKRYPGFNGLFTAVTFSTKPGAYVDQAKELIDYLQKNPSPTTVLSELITNRIVKDPINRVINDEPLIKIGGGQDNKFPHEYAISGWFKWTPVAQQPWHNIFRVSIKDPSTDAFLGDRTLTCWLGSGILHFPTYTYTNMNGAGNVNHVQNINHKERHTKWFFVYFGYQKKSATAYIYVKWHDSEDMLTYDRINHYYVPQFFLYVGRDKHFPGFNGKLGFVNFNIGQGSFRKGTDFIQDNDAFGMKAGIETLRKSAVPFSPSEADKAVRESTHDAAKPIVENERNADDTLEEYGYGFWARFMTAYPVRLLAGKNQPWYFVSRLTSNKDYDNIRMNDRTLAIWQGQGYYHFTTCNQATNNVNQIANINYPDDIEGVWTYIYYSYSADSNKAVGHIKFGGTDIQSVVHQTTHQQTKFVRFILGGTDEKRYPGFNGLFTSVTFSTRPGAYVEQAKDLADYLTRNQAPPVWSLPLSTERVIGGDPITRAINDEGVYRVLGGGDKKFPHEYALSGWFKWAQIAQQPWHNIFRVQIKTPSTDSYLGDRTLSCWLGAGFLHFPTYTYSNMNGGGNANHHQNINHNNRHMQWFFVYFGYSKKTATVNIFVKWYNSDDQLIYEKINHYFTPEFFVFVGKDKQFVGFNGQIGYINFNLGEGAFRLGKDFNHGSDAFGFDAEHLKRPAIGFDLNTDKQAAKFQSPHDGQPSVFEKTFLEFDLNKVVEYGYGFWCRYLTHYPAQLIIGKRQPWYFMARLTKNKDLNDIGVGDRTLALWQGQGYYHFTSYSGGNPNTVNNINYPEDIEGLWTFVYHSHSLEKKQSVGFIKYGRGEVIRSLQAADHLVPNYLKFYLGGMNMKYPAFNGQFESVIVSAGKGVFLENAADLLKLLEVVKSPSDYSSKVVNKAVIPKDAVFTGDITPKETVYDDLALVGEYAWSGWFKWTPVTMSAWHLGVRLAINQNSENISYLGDRTLSMWIGTMDGGVLHFTTYSYTNMLGAGNVNHWQNIPFKNDLAKWHYIYYGYSRPTREVYARVEFKGRNEDKVFKDMNHFLPNKFSLYLAKDKWHATYSGTVAYFNLNGGQGVYRRDGYDKADGDIFGYNIGRKELIKPAPQLDLSKKESKMMDSSADDREAVLHQIVPDNQLSDITQYGYGFWCRYMTRYPKILIPGKTAPWHFMARLTKNKVLGDAGLGDRTLALWQGAHYYHFTTYDGGNANAVQNINFAADIEGLWTFIWHSHSLDENQSIGFVKYGADKPLKIVQTARHISPAFLQFYLGGNNMNYPPFNGQFTNVVLSTGVGIFINSEEALDKMTATLTKPADFNSKIITKEIIVKPETFTGEITPKEININDVPLVGEYAWSGWFKWTPLAQQPWHLMIRLATIQGSENASYLGDRTLNAWVGQGYFHFTCYSYANIHGAGNVNQWQNMNYEGDLVRWHYIYFGYSRPQRLAYAKVIFRDRTADLTFKGTNHYLPNKFGLSVGKDKWHSTYSGNMAYIRFNGGDGIFKLDKFEDAPADALGYKAGKELEPPNTDPPVDPLRSQEVGTSSLASKPIVDQKFTKDQIGDASEYGVGCYIRYLFQYPVQNHVVPVVPLSIYRLTRNDPWSDVGMGDRVLALWQGHNIMIFRSHDVSTGRGDLGFNTAVGEPEGIWVFTYFSYSREARKVVGIVIIDGINEVRTQEAASNHGAINMLRLLIGGAISPYQGFSGQIANWAFKIGAGAFAHNYPHWKKHLDNRVPHPLPDDDKLKQVAIADKLTKYTAAGAPNVIEISDQSRFAAEYSVSAWIRFDQPTLPPWFKIWRMSFYDEVQNANAGKLGDRDHSLFKYDWYYHFTTYTAGNMYGHGDVNLWRNINHNENYKQWHFIYTGSSRKTKQVYHYIQFMDVETEVRIDNVNKYLVNKHYFVLGKDFAKYAPWHKPMDAAVAYVSVNYGNGAFQLKSYKPKDGKPDIFKFDKGMKELFPTYELKAIGSEKDKKFEAKCVNEPMYDVEVIDSQEYQIRGLSEYGFAFWSRFSRLSPSHMIWKQGWHQMGRLGPYKGNKQERWMHGWVTSWNYHFASHTPGGGVGVNIPYKVIEGEWNFISFTYRKGTLKSMVWLSEKDIKSGENKVNIPLIQDYIHFTIGTEPGAYCNFNGYFTNIQLRLGIGAFVDDSNFKNVATVEQPLPELLRFKQERKTIELQKEKRRILKSDKVDDIIIKPEDVEGRNEYAISGWARWASPPGDSGWDILFRVTSNSADYGNNANMPGDRTFGIWKGPGYYHMATYTVDQENGGNWNVVQNSDYQIVQFKTWSFFYFGYSRTKQAVHGYIKYATKEDHIHFANINHLTPFKFIVQLHQDRWYSTFSGFYEAWYFNTGKGAYKEKDYGQDENDAITFGFGGRTVTPVKPWEYKETFDSWWNPDWVVGKDIEYTDDSINGLTEYSYGYWSRFAWNGPKKMLDKPTWSAMSRLTTNDYYQRDAGYVGDRCLAIWLGPGYYHFTTSTFNNYNAWTNINYDQMLDGQWNYIWFGYRKTAAGGQVAGHVFFNGQAVRSTNYGNMPHPAVSDYLYFVVGSTGAKMLRNYHSFNGKFGQVQLKLGDGAFIDNADDIRKGKPEMPSFPKLKEIRKTILDEMEIMRRNEYAVAPVEFKEDAYEFEGATEYMVSIWYKWSSIGRVAWENIYSMTYSEPPYRTNHGRPGDRIMALFQYADHRTFFSSYTTPGNHDGFAHLWSECTVPTLDQNSWMYAYFGYSRQENAIYSYLKTRSTKCERKTPAMHRTPKYLALYVGKDGIHTPYNGRFAHMYLYGGPGSYRDKEISQFQPYIAGLEGIQPKPYRWTEKKAFFQLAYDQQIDVEIDAESVDGHSGYAMGFWVKYLTAIPKRLITKPQWLELARLTINKDNKDMATTGDRTLAVWIGAGYYHFTTYNQVNNQANVVQNIDYGNSLEGVWNFIYFSYSSSRQSAVGYVKFGDTDEVKRIVFSGISHRPIEMYCKIHLGKEFQYAGFNGHIQQLQVWFGAGAHCHDTEALETQIKANFNKPGEKSIAAERVNVQDDQRVKSAGEGAQIIEWPTQYEGVTEYCIFGWFRYSQSVLARPNTVMLRLTNNEPAYRKEYEQVGDRNLLIMYQPRELVFSTYSMGKLDTGLISNIRKPTSVGNNVGLWTYVWFGYSMTKKQAGGLAWFPNTGQQVVSYNDITHMVPKYFAMFSGSDGMLGGWVGPIAKVGAIFGKGAYTDPTKGNVENVLPEFKAWNFNPTFDWKPDSDKIEYVPKPDGKAIYDMTFKEQMVGMRSYGYGMWTRWLQTTPDRVIDKSPFHHMVRLTNTEKYEDNNEFGNRVLALWVGKGYYHFTTYDKAANKVSVHQNINYDDYLEGHWNYVYFSYTAQGAPRAVGFVLFGDVQATQSVSRIEFPDVIHTPLNGYARVVIANKEFIYPAFNGMMSSIRVFFNKGFVGSKEQLLREVIASYPKPSVAVPSRTDIAIIRDSQVFDKSKEGIVKQFDQFQGVLEYAVSGWLQFRRTDPEQIQNIFRLTINAPGLLKDKLTAGDRTLSAFATKDSYLFSTYDYNDLDINDDDQNDLSKPMTIGDTKGQWTYLYFGYSSKLRKAFAYALYINREDNFQFIDLKHFIPNKFWFYLGTDKFYPMFEGTLYNWNLHFGDGAFTMRPRTMVELWPYEPKDFDNDKAKSALLGNEGINSVRIYKNIPESAIFTKDSGPMSAQFKSGGGPKSAQYSKEQAKQDEQKKQ